MKNLILSLLLLTPSIFAVEAQKADESNVIKIPLEDVVSNVQILFPNSSKLKLYNRKSPLEIKSLNFLFGEVNTSGIEQLSDSYKGRLDELDHNGGIPRAKYYNQYNLRGSKPSGLEISFSIRKVDGWGYLETQIAHEIFLLHGNLKGSSPFLRRTKERYKAHFSKIYPSSPNSKPLLLKLNKDTWIHAYRMLAPLNNKGLVEYRVAKIYFEKYGKSIEVFTKSNIDLQNWFEFIKRFGRSIVKQAEQIGIYPDSNSIELVAQKRMNLFGSSGVPSFVLDAASK